MLLLLNQRYPSFGPIAGIILGTAMVVLGAASGNPMFVVWGAPSVALALVRGAHLLRAGRAGS